MMPRGEAIPLEKIMRESGIREAIIEQANRPKEVKLNPEEIALNSKEAANALKRSTNLRYTLGKTTWAIWLFLLLATWTIWTPWFFNVYDIQATNVRLNNGRIQFAVTTWKLFPCKTIDGMFTIRASNVPEEPIKLINLFTRQGLGRGLFTGSEGSKLPIWQPISTIIEAELPPAFRGLPLEEIDVLGKLVYMCNNYIENEQEIVLQKLDRGNQLRVPINDTHFLPSFDWDSPPSLVYSVSGD